jgi:Tol biopolymer transport system component
VFVDEKEIGKSPVVDRQRAFEFDTNTNAWQPHTLRLEKPGYDPIERKIDWDNGQTDYAIDLIPKQKTVKIITDPPAAAVMIEGADVRNQEGAAIADLVFTPVDETGTLRTFTAKISKQTNEAVWYPTELSIAWEEGKTDYTVKLREVLSQNTPGITLQMQRQGRTWGLTANVQPTVSMKFVTELDAQSPQRVIELPADQSVGSISVSPDGQFLVYTAVSAKSANEPMSQMFRVRTDGTGGATALSDGRSIDLTPSYTAAGDRIVYASNRASEKFSIWSISASGEGGVTRFTTGDTNDLYPSVDAEAKPRLFYQAHIDTRPDPRLYVVQLGTNLQTDLTRLGGTQPRISPRGDSVVYVSANEKTGLSDLYRVSDQGGAPESLTSQGNNIDPSWNAAGTRIVFSSDRSKEAEDGRANFDIWVLDLANPNTPRQLTNNGSIDDMPAFDPAGNAIYFRSNRGGTWGIWKLNVLRP